MSTPLLDAARLHRFAERVVARGAARIPLPELWQDFAAAFPGRPQGGEERRWLLTALHALEAEGLIRLPPAGGKRWERQPAPALPSSVDRPRPPPAVSTPAVDWRTFPWHPALAWVAGLERPGRRQLDFLQRLHQALVEDTLAEPAPIKSRSLQLCGEEKRLEQWLGGTLFRPGRLSLSLLNCYREVPPLAWERVGEGSGMLLFENAAPFGVARRVLAELPNPPYGLVGYGGGDYGPAALPHLLTLTPAPTAIDYVGDLDLQGLRIAERLREVAEACGLPPVRAALHGQMLAAAEELGHALGWPGGGPAAADGELAALCGRVIEARAAAGVRNVLAAGARIPEEVLLPTRLRAYWR